MVYSGAFNSTVVKIDLTGSSTTNPKISTGIGGNGVMIIESAVTSEGGNGKRFRIGNGTADEGQYASIRILDASALGVNGTQPVTVLGDHNVNGRFELANNIAFAKPIDLQGRSDNTVGGTAYDNSQYAAIWNFSGNNTINSAFTLTDSSTGTGNNFNFGSASGKLTVTNNLTFGPGGATGAPVLTFQGAGDGEFAGAVSGSNSLVKLGDGVLTMSGANAYSGSTSVQDGTLRANIAFFSDTADISIASGAILDLNFTGTDDVHSLFLNGVLQAPGFYGVGGLGASYFSGTGQLHVLAGALHPGDFDSDGDVDGADFVAWQTHFPTPSGATLADGDADGDGDVDGADFVVWQTNFPFSPGPATSPVPEPNAWILGLLATTGLTFGKWSPHKK
jgi:autotransporter-associated beta strand protein